MTLFNFKIMSSFFQKDKEGIGESIREGIFVINIKQRLNKKYFKGFLAARAYFLATKDFRD